MLAGFGDRHSAERWLTIDEAATMIFKLPTMVTPSDGELPIRRPTAAQAESVRRAMHGLAAAGAVELSRVKRDHMWLEGPLYHFIQHYWHYALAMRLPITAEEQAQEEAHRQARRRKWNDLVAEGKATR
jgi:hypothetical protein